MHPVARPAHRMDDVPEQPTPVELRYLYHRSQRAARVRAAEESRLARYRFYVMMVVLLVLAGVFVVVAWHEIQHLFGL